MLNMRLNHKLTIADWLAELHFQSAQGSLWPKRCFTSKAGNVALHSAAARVVVAPTAAVAAVRGAKAVPIVVVAWVEIALITQEEGGRVEGDGWAEGEGLA